MQGRIDRVLADIRSDVCDTVLKWTALTGAVAAGLALFRALEFGFLPVMALHVAMVALLSAVYVQRKRIPFSVRAGAIIAAMFAVALGGHISFGAPMRIEFFVAASIMSAVFFGEKVGILMTAGCVTTVGAVFAGFYFGLLPQPLQLPALSPTNWLANVASMIVAAMAPLIAVNRYRRQLNFERERAAAASRAKSDFLATMSHELRTPMAAILGMTDLLASGRLRDEEKEQVSRISNAGRLLLDLLNDILDFSKIESNKVVLQLGPFSPRDLVEEIRGLFAPTAAQRKLGLSIDFGRDLPAFVVGDGRRIRQAVLNLVGNAVKFTEHGGVIIRVNMQGSADSKRLLVIDVEDTGIGIAPDQQTLLFQPFFQIDQGETRRFGGTGLGLSISRRLIELMGGSITLRSVVGQGATFTISVPVAESFAEVPAVAVPQQNALANAPSFKLLVAEDNESIAFLIETMLKRWGHDVDTVADGKAALTAATSRRYDAILMDMHMPHMDGATATRAIRKLSGEVSRVPIIAITADIVGESTSDYLKAGADALVSKPINWGELAATLGRLCASSTAIDGPGAPPARGDAPPAVLDRQVLSSLKAALGDGAYDALMTSFSANIEILLEEASRAFRENDLREIKRLAHKVKGVCSQFGALQVAELAARIDADPASAGLLGSKLLEALNALRTSLKDIRTAPKP